MKSLKEYTELKEAGEKNIQDSLLKELKNITKYSKRTKIFSPFFCFNNKENYEEIFRRSVVIPRHL